MKLTMNQAGRCKKIYESMEGGITSFREISKKTKIDRSTISSYVNNGFIEAWKKDNEINQFDKKGFTDGDCGKTRMVWDKTKKGFSVLRMVKSEGEDTKKEVMDFLDNLKFEAPKFEKIKRSGKKGKIFSILDPADVHLQKLSCFNPHYDVRSYIKDLNKGVDNLLSILSEENNEKIIVVIGNDVLHVDGESNETTRGTRQDSSMSWNNSYELAFDWYQRLLLRTVEIADVHVVFNKSNHDKHLGFALAHCLEKYFENHKNMTFDCSFNEIKSFFCGGAGMCFSHGDKGKPKDYAHRLPFALKGGFDKSKSFHFYLHHRHHAEKFDVKDFGQVTVETVRSPSVPDQWHADKGYESIRCVSAFVHDYDTGFQTKRINHLFTT